MWLFYKEKKYLIISLIILILDGILVNYIPSFFNRLNYFFPMLTISLIPFLYHDNKRKYYIYVLILGIIYDVLYTDIFLYNAIIFSFLGVIDLQIRKYYKDNIILFLFLIILNIILYDSILFSLVFITNYQSITISDLIYKIEHSLLLNIMSGFVFWFMFKKNNRRIIFSGDNNEI